MKKAFTVIELMLVIAILGILITIVTTAASGAMKAARERRRQANAIVLREGITTYYARRGEWPGAIESAAEKGNDQIRVFAGSEADAIFQKVVKESSGGKNPYLDPHALFVAPTGITEGKGPGITFAEARSKQPPPHRRRLTIEQMAFGYQDPSSGRFRRYKIEYRSASDSVEVTW